MSEFKELESNNHRVFRTFQYGDDPELIHIIKLGYKDTYAVFEEDAYEQEPWKSGLQVLAAYEIKEKFNIEL